MLGKFVDYETLRGEENMEKDRFLLEQAIKENSQLPVLRFYGWKPACVSLGRNQTLSNINVDYCKKYNIDITKRITGGRALLHDNELTYSFVCTTKFLDNENVQKSYEIISNALVKGFKSLGIEAEFGNSKPDTKYNYCMLLSTGADLNYKGKKLVGSAQYRSNGYILQHGSILYTLNEKHIENIFNEKIANKLITLSEILPEINTKELIDCFKSGFEKEFNVKFM